MATRALLVKSLFQIESGLRTMASKTTKVLISFLKFTLVQNVFSTFIDVMAVLARKSCFDMAVMRKRHRRSGLPLQHNLIRLSPQGRSGEYEKENNGDYQNPAAYHFHSLVLQRVPLLLQPALRKNLVKLRIDILRPEDASGKSDHAGNMNTDRAVAAATKHAVSPHDSLHLRQKFPVHLAPFPV
jgi:hypothetical protein